MLTAIHAVIMMMMCVVFDLQTINKLEDLLDGIGVNYTNRQFDSGRGILDLSQPVFVSLILYYTGP